MARPTTPAALDRFARSYQACVLCGATVDLVVAHVDDQKQTLARQRAELPAFVDPDQRDRYADARFVAEFHHPRNVTRLCRTHEDEYTAGLIDRRDLVIAREAAIQAAGPLPFLRYLYDESRADHHCRDLMGQMYAVRKINEFWRKDWRESPPRFLIKPKARMIGAIHQHFNVGVGLGGGTGCGGCPHYCETERGIPSWAPRR
ncbi:hypothetical protein AB0B66_10755 [Catellatospora sp. NPDC049111]|uniref:hypothetical protein n=1 Tax=Catellatospora sp. NPDC049111 TaxID=3155271 RepID=UPI0033FA4072